MKCKKSYILMLVITVISCIIQLLFDGVYRDNHPLFYTNRVILWFFWIALFIACFVIPLMAYIYMKKEKGSLQLLGLAISILFITTICFNVHYYTLVYIFQYSTEQSMDYIQSEQYRGISLDELKRDFKSDERVLLYIGRDDCRECIDLEEQLSPLLEEYNFELSTYYTTQDRSGIRRDEMYEFLEEYAIESVPTILVVQQSEVIQKWDDPINSLEEIKEYF